MKLLFFIFFLIPLCSAKFNCTYLDGEQKNVCKYLKKSNLSNSEKETLMQEILDKGASLDGDFNSIDLDKNIFQINKVPPQKVSEETKQTIKEIISISFFGYIVFQFLKKYFSRSWDAE